MHQQILVAVERQARIEAFVVITMAPFYFTIVSRRPWTNKLVDNALFLAIEIKGERSLCLTEMSKFKAIIRLYDFWLIVEMFDGHFDTFPLLCRLALVKALLSKKTEKGAWMTLIATLKLEFRVQFNEGERYVLTA